MNPSGEHQIKLLLLLVALALVRGIVYSAVVPLWQAPDEPAHFEYIKLLLEKRRLLNWDDVSLSIRREIALSMVDLYDDRYGPGSYIEPKRLLAGDPPDIPGPSELWQPPLYYTLNALFLLPLQQQEIAVQAYAARFVSVLMSAAIIAIALLTARELFPNDSFLMIGIPALILFTPAHTFMASTINNDHLSELISSLFICLWVRIFRRGLSIWRATALSTLAALSLWTKGSTLPILLSGLVAGLIRLSGRLLHRISQRQLVALVLIATICLASSLLTLNPKGLAFWYTSDRSQSTQSDSCARTGSHSIYLRDGETDKVEYVFQSVLSGNWLEFREKPFTLGVWVQTAQDEQEGYIQLYDGSSFHTTSFTATPQWTLHAIQGSIDPSSSELKAILGVGKETTGELFFDDVFLIPQHVDLDAIPEATAFEAANLLINPSGEEWGWDLRPWVYEIVNDYGHMNVRPGSFPYLLNAQRLWKHRDSFAFAFRNLFQVFWAAFGIRSVYLDTAWYLILLLANLGAVGGLVLHPIRVSRGRQYTPRWRKEAFLFFCCCVVLTSLLGLAWVPFWLRLPHARYLYVAMIPIATLLILGWRELIPDRWHQPGLLAIIAGFSILDLVSLLNYVLPAFFS